MTFVYQVEVVICKLSLLLARFQIASFEDLRLSGLQGRTLEKEATSV